MRRSLWSAVLVVLCVAPHTGAQDMDAEDVMRSLRQQFETSAGYSARFRQTLDAQFASSTSVVFGTIILSGDKYRIETDDQTIVTDGETTWVHLIEDEQVIVNDYVDDEESFTPAHFLDERAERYDVSFAEEQTPDEYVVRLTAKSPDTYIESATLWIYKVDLTVSRIDVVDVNEAFIRFEMSDVTLLSEVEDSVFTFVPRDELEVIDLR